MLILDREIDQKNVIVVPPSDKPTVIVETVTEFRYGSRHRVKLGYEAAPEVEIDRMEIYQAKQREAADKARRDAERAKGAGKGEVTP